MIGISFLWDSLECYFNIVIIKTNNFCILAIWFSLYHQAYAITISNQWR